MIVSIIQRDKNYFSRRLALDDLGPSRVTGLAPIHFAICWPWALQQLIIAGADINCEDKSGRRPIHLAVACGPIEAVEILLQADCSIYTHSYFNSLLQEAKTRQQTDDYVVTLIVDALIDRHTRLINLAMPWLPDGSDLKKHLRQGIILENRAPELLEALTTHGYPVPRSLEVDNNSVYYGLHDTIYEPSLTVTLANKLWEDGFHCIDDFMPHNSLTPFLASWYKGDFDMVSWFIERGRLLLPKTLQACIRAFICLRLP